MIRDVRRLKADYQDREEYDEAQRLSVLEHKMAEAGARILELEALKRSAVDREDYAAAKQACLCLCVCVCVFPHNTILLYICPSACHYISVHIRSGPIGLRSSQTAMSVRILLVNTLL